MRELRQRAEPVLKIICLILAAWLLYELAGIFMRLNPFRGVTVPQLPSLAASTNTPVGGGHGTNLLASVTGKETNGAPLPAGTNLTPPVIVANTNSVLPSLSAENGTNSTPRPKLTMTETNLGTNVVTRLENQLNGTNFMTATNLAGNGTNLLISTNAAGTNDALHPKPEMKIASTVSPPEMGGMSFNPFQPPKKPGGDLPAAVQLRVSRITDSEIFGPVMHPLPMALLGIAGEDAFLRSANGQTGLVKEGDSLGDIKLLRIGINRVLIEQDGQKKELTIFSGYGGDSLLPNDTSNESKHP
jgi:hypothetical protein